MNQGDITPNFSGLKSELSQANGAQPVSAATSNYPLANTTPANAYISPGVANTVNASYPNATPGYNSGIANGVFNPSLVSQNAAAGGQQQLNAPTIAPPQQFGAGVFSGTTTPPATVTSAPYGGTINQFGADIPYFTAQTNLANAQQQAEQTQALGQLGTGFNTALGQLSTAGASESQALQNQYQQNLGQNAQAMANAGLTGSTVDAGGMASAQRTLNLGQTQLAEQIGSAKATLIAQGSQALAAQEVQPQYQNDNSLLLQGMAAQSNVALSESSLATQQNIASSANTSNLISAGVAAGTGLVGAGITASALGGAAAAAGGGAAAAGGGGGALLSLLPILAAL